MATRVSGLILAFLLQILLSRTLGADQFGSYAIALGWAMVLVIPARLGLDNSALRFATVYHEDGRNADFRGLVNLSLTCIFLLSMLIATSLLTAKATGLKPLRPIELTLLVGVASLVMPLALLGWFSALIRTANRIFASQFYEQVLRPTLLIAAIGVFALAGQQLNAGTAMLATSATVALATIGIAVHAWMSFRGVASGRASFKHHREWLSVSWVLFLMAVVQELLNQVDLILLGILGNATQAGHFAAAWRLASLVPFGLVAIATVSAPMIASANHRGDIAELSRIARLSARFSALFAVAMAFLLAAIGEFALGLFGPGFSAAYPALLVLLAGGLVNSFTGTVGYLLIMTGHQRASLAILAAALVVSIVTNLLLIPRLGTLGAAIASAMALSSWNLIMVGFVRRRIGVDATALGLQPRPKSSRI